MHKIRKNSVGLFFLAVSTILVRGEAGDYRTASGVIDRITETNEAVILLSEKNDQLIISLEKLPIKSKEGIWVTIYFKSEQDLEIIIDKRKSEKMFQENKRIQRCLQQKITD